eukprot:gnl/TRDRNA2_/TRDRNA2_158685_c0_seq2.p1 gnl/TRDRNA2_/TRDRNA2_158685_c0~~gnl/TRDRNA2_/TRDRNA2_158685_c0_seq2.p1  ORF type:complete len:566 (+),score=110.95 gnl/TRDRNA2_/TRDRNA2_158685_c0_seq2:140-1837(+)
MAGLWQRLSTRRPSVSSAANDVSSAPPVSDERVEAAAAAVAALEQWSVARSNPMNPTTKGINRDGEAGFSLLARAAHLFVLAPKCPARDSLLDDMRRILGTVALVNGQRRMLGGPLLPEAGDVLEAQLVLLQDADCLNSQMAEVIGDAFAALVLPGSEPTPVSGKEVGTGDGMAESAEDLPLESSRLTLASAAASTTWVEDVLKQRRSSLREADMQLGSTQQSTAGRICEANERLLHLQQKREHAVAAGTGVEAASTGPAFGSQSTAQSSLGTEAAAGTLIDVEHEMNRLQERMRQLKSEMDVTSSALEDSRAKQRKLLAQADGWRSDLDGVRSSTQRAEAQGSAVAAAREQVQKRCKDFLSAFEAVHEGLRNAVCDKSVESAVLADAADQDTKDASAALHSESDAWLASSVTQAEAWRSENARAVRTFALLDVELPADSSLPTRQELAPALSRLRSAWAERIEFGEVNPAQQEKVESLLAELGKEEQEAQSGGAAAASRATAASTTRPLAASCAVQADVQQDQALDDVSATHTRAKAPCFVMMTKYRSPTCMNRRVRLRRLALL